MLFLVLGFEFVGCNLDLEFLLILEGFFFFFFQLEASTNQELNQRIPHFNLPSKILCRVVHIQLLVGCSLSLSPFTFFFFLFGCQECAGMLGVICCVLLSDHYSS